MTREKILAAAKELFEEKGFDFTTVRDIALKADVNIALINYHFGSKEALLITIVEERANETYIRLTDINKSEADPAAKMQTALETMIDKIFANRKFYQMLHQELSTVHRPDVSEKVIKILKRNRQEIRQIIEEGQRTKVFRDDIDIELTLGTLFGLFHQVTNAGFKFVVKESDAKLKTRLREHSNQLINIFLKRK